MAQNTVTAPRQIEVNWSKDMVDQFNKRWQEFWKWADQTGVPIPLKEAALRDLLAGIEGMRTANALQFYLPVLRGTQQ